MPEENETTGEDEKAATANRTKNPFHAWAWSGSPKSSGPELEALHRGTEDERTPVVYDK